MRYQVLIGQRAAEIMPGDLTVTVTADSKLDAVYQATIGLAGGRPAGQLRRLVVKAVVSEAEVMQLAAGPEATQDVVRDRRPELTAPVPERELAAWMTKVRDQINARRS